MEQRDIDEGKYRRGEIRIRLWYGALLQQRSGKRRRSPFRCRTGSCHGFSALSSASQNCRDNPRTKEGFCQFCPETLGSLIGPAMRH
jgi:hypothetical protein